MTITGFDFSDPHAYVGGPPHEYFDYIREHHPAFWFADERACPPGFWVLTKYHDVITVSRDAALFSSGAHGSMMEESDEAAGLLINTDAPYHTRMRNLVARMFTPKTIREMEPHIREAASDIFDRAEAAAAASSDGVIDFVENLAMELPLVLICELIGVPMEDRHKVFNWSNRMIGRDDDEYGGGAEDAMNASLELYTYFQAMADDRRANPKSDIITLLLNAEVEGEHLTDLEFNMFMLLLSVAGNETTRNSISGGMLALFEHPDQRAILQADLESVMPTAIDEILRYVSPVMAFRRTAMREVEMHGQTIKADDAVMIWYGAANRDPEIFKNPHVFDVRRFPNEHIAFGGRGPHYCLGVALAKMQLTVFYETLFARFPRIEQAGEPQRLASFLINGIRHLPVKLNA